MKRYTAGLFLLLSLLPMMLVWGQQATGVTAEAIGQANLRARPDVNADLVGEIANGTSYPVVGRSEFFPWVLLGDATTFQPFGWVFVDLVTITGNINLVPFSSVDLTNQQTNAPQGQAPTATLAAIATQPPVQLGQPTLTLPPNVTPITGGAAGGDSGNGGVPQAEPSATPNFAVFGSVSGEVNVRYGPGVDFAILGRAFAGDTFEITGYSTQFPWLQIAYADSPNGFAWIAENLLEVTGDVFSLPAIVQTNFDLPTLTPTPSLLQSSSFPGLSDELRPEFAALGDRVWNQVLEAGFVPGASRFGALYIQDLQTGEAMTFGNDFAFSGTSINKIAILTEYFAAQDLAPPLEDAIDIANTMICSENVATNSLLGFVGQGDQILGAEMTTQLLFELGMTRTFLTAPYDTTTPAATATPMPRAVSIPQTTADQVSANPNPTNQMTVEEMGWLLSSIYECAYDESGPLIDNYGGAYTPQECRKMMHVMSNNTVDALLKAGVPASIRVAHKHGWIEDTHGNAAVFFTPGGDYIMVMMLHEPGFLQYSVSLPIIANASREVYNFYNPDAPLTEVREGFIPETADCRYTATDLLVNDLASPFFLSELDPALFYNGDLEATEEAEQ